MIINGSVKLFKCSLNFKKKFMKNLKFSYKMEKKNLMAYGFFE
jgi:hypothetical protein